MKTNCFNKLMSLLIVIICITCVNSYAEERQENHFYFVQITDTHFGDEDHLDRTKKAVELINNLPMPIKCVVHTGDITADKIEDKSVIDFGGNSGDTILNY